METVILAGDIMLDLGQTPQSYLLEVCLLLVAAVYHSWRHRCVPVILAVGGSFSKGYLFLVFNLLIIKIEHCSSYKRHYSGVVTYKLWLEFQ